MRIILTLTLLTCFGISHGQQSITVEDIYTKGTFSERSVRGINWMNDGRYYSAREGNNIVKYDVTTGEIVETIFDNSTLDSPLEIDAYQFTSDESKLLLMTDRVRVYRRSYTAEFYIYDLASKSITKLSDNGKQAYATLSPDGTKIAFYRDNNLFYTNLDSGEETAITTDGKFNEIINGSTDWVYEEELSFTKAFEWSGDSESIFYLTFDESGVREYNMQVWNRGQLYPTDYRFKYPKAGEDNSKVTATIYNIASKTKTPVDLGTDQEYYVARIKKTASRNTWSLTRLNRLQNQLDILHVSTNGSVKTILSEKNDRYIDIDFIDELTYLKNGKHLIHASERTGYKHLYLYTIE